MLKYFDKYLVLAILDMLNKGNDLKQEKHIFKQNTNDSALLYKYIWRPPSLRELTLMIFNTELTHIGSEASIYYYL